MMASLGLVGIVFHPVVAQTNEQTLRMDEPVNGRLASNDGIAFWDIQAEAGMIVSVDLESNDFDTVVALFNDQNEIVASDDDSGRGRNSRIAGYVIPSDGIYTIGLVSFYDDEGGDYRLVVRDDSAVVPTAQIAADVVQEATFDAVSNTQVWQFKALPERIYSIEMESTQVDTQLWVYRGGLLLFTNDDFGESTNSRLPYVIFAPGVYLLTASTYEPDETGLYQISVQDVTDSVIRAEIQPGETVTASFIRQNNATVHYWEFNGIANQTVTIDMRSQSNELSPYLYLFDANGQLIGRQDDTGSSGQIRLEGVLDKSGRYIILATSFRFSDVGDYTLTLEIE
jgi:hypothetical protein